MDMKEENFEILKLRNHIQEKFEEDIIVIEKMIQEMNSKQYEEYISNLGFMRDCPFEDAIRYRFILAVETFKRFSKALSFTYFKYGSSVKNKYQAMNEYFLPNRALAKKIDEVISDRDRIAHVWVESYLHYTDIKPEKRLELLKRLNITLKIYNEFIDRKGLSNIKKVRIS